MHKKTQVLTESHMTRHYLIQYNLRLFKQTLYNFNVLPPPLVDKSHATPIGSNFGSDTD